MQRSVKKRQQQNNFKWESTLQGDAKSHTQNLTKFIEFILQLSVLILQKVDVKALVSFCMLTWLKAENSVFCNY